MSSRIKVDIETIRSAYVGKYYHVWWNTGHTRNGRNVAKVLEVLPYNGPFDFVLCIFRLEAEDTRRGWLGMSIEQHMMSAPVE